MKSSKHLFGKLRVRRSSPSAPFVAAVVRLSSLTVSMSLLLATQIHGATAPSATLMYTASGPVHGGVATIGTSGVTYLTALSANGNPSKLIALNANGTEKWPPFTPGTNMYAIPALDAGGTNLYIGSDAGIFYCRKTSDGSTAWSFTVPSGTDKRIRSGAARRSRLRSSTGMPLLRASSWTGPQSWWRRPRRHTSTPGMRPASIPRARS